MAISAVGRAASSTVLRKAAPSLSSISEVFMVCIVRLRSPEGRARPVDLFFRKIVPLCGEIRTAAVSFLMING